MKRNLKNSALALLLLPALLAACSKKEQPAPAQPKKAQPAQPAAQSAAQQQMSSAAGLGQGRLDFSKRTDPFKAFMPAAPAAPVPAPESARRPGAEVLPIQSFEVTKFKVVGIIAGLNQNRALVIDPTGKGYVVQEGMQIGSSDGRITRITPSSVEVVERYREDNGRIRKRKIVLQLAKKR